MLEEDLAKRLFNTVPSLMAIIRTEVRECAKESLSIPQFRVLANINRGLNHVADIANHHGVSQPSMTKLVNNLVAKGLILREKNTEDRRLVNLHLTPDGKKLFKQIKKRSLKSLSQKIKCVDRVQLEKL